MTTTRNFARYIALPVVSAGILGAAALGLAGMANAGTYSYQPTPRRASSPPRTRSPGRPSHSPPRLHGLVIDIPSGE